MVRSYSPLRIEKIDEVKQMLEKNDYFPIRKGEYDLTIVINVYLVTYYYYLLCST